MKQKGFTLIELLAVVLIISITLLLVFTSVIKIMQQNRNTKFNEYEKLMKTAADLYFEKNIDASYICLIKTSIEGDDCLNKEDKDTLIGSNLLKPFGEGYVCNGLVRKDPETVRLICTKNDQQIWPEE